MHPFLFAARWGWFQEGRFLGKVLDEWADDAQEFIHSKLPHLILVAIIAIILNRLLRLVTARMIHVAEQHASGQTRVSQVRTLAGVIRTTGVAIIASIVGLQVLAAMGMNLAPLLASAGVAGVAGVAAGAAAVELWVITITVASSRSVQPWSARNRSTGLRSGWPAG